MFNRLEIVQWREFGDDDDTTDVHPYAADDQSDPLENVLKDYGVDVSEHDPEAGKDAYFVIQTSTIASGDELVYRGRKFRVTIEEIQ